MADFQEQLAPFEERDTAIVAASADSFDDALKVQTEDGLTFDVAHGLDVEDVARRTGAFFNPERGCLNATGFLVNADGSIAHAVYATGPIGRFSAAATLRALDYMISQAK